MGRDRWHVIEEEGTLTLARRLPVRFDLRAETVLPAAVGRLRLAHIVRQDLWRMLRDLRGFAPVVRVRRVAAGLHVVAGGAVAGRVPPGSGARLAALLDDPRLRARWMRQAR
jgi:hypothetical protein